MQCPRDGRDGDIRRPSCPSSSGARSAPPAPSMSMLENTSLRTIEKSLSSAMYLNACVAASARSSSAGVRAKAFGSVRALRSMPHQQLHLVRDFVDDDRWLAAFLQQLQFVARPLHPVEILAITLRQIDLVHARQLALLEPADQAGVEVVQIAGIGIGIARRDVTDRRRRVGAALRVAYRRRCSVRCRSWSVGRTFCDANGAWKIR